MGSRWWLRALTEPFPAGIIEIRSIRVGVVALKAVHTGFFVAMSRRGHLYGSVSAWWGWLVVGRHWQETGSSGLLMFPTLRSGSTLLTVGSRSALKRTATTPMPHFAGVTEASPCSWRWTGGGSLDAVAGHGGTIFPLISCPSWSPEAPRGHEARLDKIQKTSGQVARDQRLEEAQAVAKPCLVTHSFHKH